MSTLESQPLETCCTKKHILKIIYKCGSYPPQTYNVCLEHFKIESFSTNTVIISVLILPDSKQEIQELLVLPKFADIIKSASNFKEIFH